MKGGLLHSYALGGAGGHTGKGELSFVQISDSHVGFSKPANPDVAATLKAAIDKINALSQAPEFLLHTGDISHLSKPGEFDNVDQVLKSAKVGGAFFVPGEHDVLNDDGQQYRERYARGTQGAGWYSFDKNGIHFIRLVKVMNLKAGGLGNLGNEQLEWMETGSVTVLNGHIHQTMQKVEGNVTFHTAMSTAFPQPKPGQAPSPGPMKVPDDELRSVLGITDVNFVKGSHPLAVTDQTLG